VRRGGVRVTIYGSQDPADLATDPLPWMQEDEYSHDRTRHAERPYYSQNDRILSYWKPRPEFMPRLAHPHNPILAAFRRRLKYQADVNQPITSSGLASIWISDIVRYSGSVQLRSSFEQIDHARRVLTRLANPHTTNEQEKTA
jgi:phosphohistidine phosphatase SixA